MATTDWVRVCVNYEHQQRRQAIEDKVLIYIGSEYDIAETNSEYTLIPTRECCEEWD